MSEFPRTLKHLTVWLLLLTLIFVGFQAWQRSMAEPRFSIHADGSIELHRGPDGHFHWPGTVNGRPVDFLVDTGATHTALPEALAEGLETVGTVQSVTAGGTVQGRVVRADLQLDGGVSAQGWRMTALPQLRAPLLGMDVLGRLSFTQSDGVLRLRAPDGGASR